jgi:hypothetical protein
MNNAAFFWSAVLMIPLVLFPVPAFRQQLDTPPPVRKLERYIGKWNYAGEDKTPVTGGAVTCTSTRRWISGGYFVESHRECKTPRGDVTQVEVFGYDSTSGGYLYWGFNGSVVSTYRADMLDDAIVWIGFGASSGNRCTEIFAPDHNSSTDKCESTRDGGKTWVLRSAGKLIRDKVAK